MQRELDLLATESARADQGGIAVAIAPGAVILRRFAVSCATALRSAISDVESRAAFRRMSTPGGGTMSVAMTNCGRFGWVSDHSGYRYSECDPLTGGPWPPIPSVFTALAQDAATVAGFDGFVPDACLINRYLPGSQLALHQDRDEQDLSAPIVSVSLGSPAVFLFGGSRRRVKPARYELLDGDVVVWGGAARLRYHGIAKLRCGSTSAPGAVRYNLTLRKAA